MNDGGNFAAKAFVYGNMRVKDMTNEQLKEYLEMREAMDSMRSGISHVMDVIRDKIKEG